MAAEMVRIAMHETWARKRRLFGVFVAVFIGVAFLAGTLVLGDTLGRNFDTLFSGVTKGTDVVVRSATQVKSDRALAQRGPIDGGLAARLAAVDGVAKAEPAVEGYGALLDRAGEPIGGNGPPRLAGNWLN